MEILSLRSEVLKTVRKKYGTKAEYPWLKLPEYAVLRHSDNKKWYGIIMNIPRSKLGLSGSGNVDILDIKADPIMLGSLILQDGIFRGYHMNKGNWITILLDGTVDKEQIFILLDYSFEMTGIKKLSSQRNTNWLVPVNPKYYDIDAKISENPNKFLMKQGANICGGDTVYLYIAAPVSAIKYKCRVLKADIPYEYEDKNIRLQKVMELKLLKKYAHDPVTIAKMRELGVTTVRGARGMPDNLISEINRNDK